jgi:hypothetical protein
VTNSDRRIHISVAQEYLDNDPRKTVIPQAVGDGLLPRRDLRAPWQIVPNPQGYRWDRVIRVINEA